jgi:hypothetical protein
MGWATCPHTELGFLRFSIQPVVMKTEIDFRDAMTALTTSLAKPGHDFWPADDPVGGCPVSGPGFPHHEAIESL